MLNIVAPPILSRRAILSSLGGAGLAAMLSACGGSKATSIADTVFATNEARNAAATAGSAATTGSAAAGTPAAAGSQTASTAAPGSSVAATGSRVAGTASVTTSGGGIAPAASATGPTSTHITGVGSLPKPLPTQGGAPPTIVGVSAASPASGTPASVPSQILATAGVATASGSSVAGTAAPSPSAAPATQVAITADRAFNPPQVTIRTGQAIQWVNMGRAPQTVTGDPARAANKQDALLPAGAQPWDSGVLNPGARYAHTFTTPGDYVYFSIPFESQGMIGRITVTG